MLFDFFVVFMFFIILFCGYKKGFSQMLLSLGTFLLSIFLVFGIFKYISDTFFTSDYGTKLTTDVAESIETRVLEIAGDGCSFYFLTSFLDNNPNEINEISQALAKKALTSLVSIPLLIISFVLLTILIFSIILPLKFNHIFYFFFHCFFTTCQG